MLKDHHWYSLGVGALFGAITIVIAAFLLVYWGDIKSALTPRPENFTELYFERHLELPKTIIQGDEYPILFTIHNVEHKTVAYPFEIYREDEQGVRSEPAVYSAQISLAHDESETIPFTLRLPAGEPRREKIVIRLLNLDQTIHFWVQSASKSATLAAPPASVSAEASHSAILSPL